VNNPVVLVPPVLDHDKMMYERFGCDSHLRVKGRLERRIVWNLFAHLAQHGWLPWSVFDGEERTRTYTPKAAMELMFNLDEVHVTMRDLRGNEHWIFFTLGEGVDIICDYSFAPGGKDNFEAAMDAFDGEDFG
jgi:hypothetical protein